MTSKVQFRGYGLEHPFSEIRENLHTYDSAAVFGQSRTTTYVEPTHEKLSAYAPQCQFGVASTTHIYQLVARNIVAGSNGVPSSSIDVKTALKNARDEAKRVEAERQAAYAAEQQRYADIMKKREEERLVMIQKRKDALEAARVAKLATKAAAKEARRLAAAARRAKKLADSAAARAAVIKSTAAAGATAAATKAAATKAVRKVAKVTKKAVKAASDSDDSDEDDVDDADDADDADDPADDDVLDAEQEVEHHEDEDSAGAGAGADTGTVPLVQEQLLPAATPTHIQQNLQQDILAPYTGNLEELKKSLDEAEFSEEFTEAHKEIFNQELISRLMTGKLVRTDVTAVRKLSIFSNALLGKCQGNSAFAAQDIGTQKKIILRICQHGTNAYNAVFSDVSFVSGYYED